MSFGATTEANFGRTWTYWALDGEGECVGEIELGGDADALGWPHSCARIDACQW